MGDLANRIRAKYPGAYDGVDDDELERRLVAKYPQYAPFVAPQNLLPQEAPTTFSSLYGPGGERHELKDPGATLEEIQQYVPPPGGGISRSAGLAWELPPNASAEQIQNRAKQKALVGVGAIMSGIPGSLPVELALGAAGGALIEGALPGGDPLEGAAYDVAGQLALRGLGGLVGLGARGARALRRPTGEVAEEAVEGAARGADEAVPGTAVKPAGKPATRRALQDQLLEMDVPGNELTGKSASQLREMVRQRGAVPRTAAGGVRVRELAEVEARTGAEPPERLPAPAIDDVPEVDRSLTKMGDNVADLEAKPRVVEQARVSEVEASAARKLEEEPDTLFDQRFQEDVERAIDAPPGETIPPAAVSPTVQARRELARHVWHPEHGVVRVDARKGDTVIVSTRGGRSRMVNISDLVNIDEATAKRLGEEARPISFEETPAEARPRTEAEAMADLEPAAPARALASGTTGPRLGTEAAPAAKGTKQHAAFKRRTTSPYVAAEGPTPRTPKNTGLPPALAQKLGQELHLQRTARQVADIRLTALRAKQAQIILKWRDAMDAGEVSMIEGAQKLSEEMTSATAKYKGLKPDAFTGEELEALAKFAKDQDWSKDQFRFKRALDNLQTMQEGRQLQPKEIEEVRQVFFAQDKLPKTSRIWDILGWLATHTSGTLKALKASWDLSAPGRQAFPLTVRHPVKAAGAFVDQVRALFGKGTFEELQDAVINNPLRYLQELSGLHLSDLATSTRSVAAELGGAEEVFAGGSIAKYVPGVAASERAYITFLNKMRSEVFNKGAMELLKTPYKTLKDGTVLYKNFDTHAREFIDLARAVNELSGRGELAIRLGNKRFINLENRVVTPILNSFFFSPRFIMSRLGLLTDLFHLYSNYSPQARKLMLESMATSIMTNLSLLGLAAVAGASVEFDPRSTDFAKIRLGNTRIDPWFGLQPWVRAFVQFGLGQTKSTRTGKIRELGDPSVFKGDTRLDVAGRFIRGKFSPGVNLALDVARGRPAFGNEPLEFFKDEFPYLGDDTLEQITPLVIQDIREAWEQGETDHLALTIPLSVVGVGVQTHEGSRRKVPR